MTSPIQVYIYSASPGNPTLSINMFSWVAEVHQPINVQNSRMIFLFTALPHAGVYISISTGKLWGGGGILIKIILHPPASPASLRKYCPIILPHLILPIYCNPILRV